MAVKGLVAAIVQFLTQQLEDDNTTADSRESLEVAIQCLESAYNVQASDNPASCNLLEIFKSTMENAKAEVPPDGTPGEKATPEAKAEAERLKNEGNALMKENNPYQAVVNYTKAILLDRNNAVYYCNRAAAYNRMGNHQQAIKDCYTALSIDPTYSKAYGRMGLAYSTLGRHKEAKENYQKALEMEPDNESYKNNLQVAEEKLAQQGMSNMGLGTEALPGMDITALLSNPVLMNMVRQMLLNPSLHNMWSSFLSANVDQDRHTGVLIGAGQQIAQQIQNANPELIETLSRLMGGNPNDPEPPQQN